MKRELKGSGVASRSRMLQNLMKRELKVVADVEKVLPGLSGESHEERIERDLRHGGSIMPSKESHEERIERLYCRAVWMRDCAF